MVWGFELGLLQFRGFQTDFDSLRGKAYETARFQTVAAGRCWL